MYKYNDVIINGKNKIQCLLQWSLNYVKIFGCICILCNTFMKLVALGALILLGKQWIQKVLRIIINVATVNSEHYFPFFYGWWNGGLNIKE